MACRFCKLLCSTHSLDYPYGRKEACRLQGHSSLFLRKGTTSSYMVLAVGSLIVAVGVVVVVEILVVVVDVIMVVDCYTGPPRGRFFCYALC